MVANPAVAPLVVLGLALVLQSGAQAEVVVSESFDTNEALDTFTPWVIQLGAGVPSYSWVSNDGAPEPGSVRIELPADNGNYAVRLMSPCFPLSPKLTYSVSAQAKSDAPLSCLLGFMTYSTPGCGGEPFIEEWPVLRSSEWKGFVRTRDPYLDEEIGLVSTRAYISQEGSGFPSFPGAACLFDSFVLERQVAAAVPTTKDLGLIILVGLLGFTGIRAIGKPVTRPSSGLVRRLQKRWPLN